MNEDTSGFFFDGLAISCLLFNVISLPVPSVNVTEKHSIQIFEVSFA
jgi:hypothetical protein